MMLASKFQMVAQIINSTIVNLHIMLIQKVKTLMDSHVNYIQVQVITSKAVLQNTIQMMDGIVMQHMVQ
jgi:hypothetical protein